MKAALCLGLLLILRQDGSITVDAIRRMLIASITAEMALSSGFQSYP